MHSTPGIVHEGILDQSENDENRFYLIGIWNNRDNHRTAVAKLRDMHPAWLDLLDTPLVPEYLQIIGMTLGDSVAVWCIQFTDR